MLHRGPACLHEKIGERVGVTGELQGVPQNRRLDDHQDALSHLATVKLSRPGTSPCSLIAVTRTLTKHGITDQRTGVVTKLDKDENRVCCLGASGNRFQDDFDKYLGVTA